MNALFLWIPLFASAAFGLSDFPEAISFEGIALEEAEKGEKPWEKIWGLNGEFDTPSETNKDFAETMSILASLRDLSENEKELKDLKEDTLFFNGKVYRCRCNHVMGELRDCCGKMAALLSKCSREEKELRKLRDEQRCHRVPVSVSDGVLHYNKTKVYCCYPTKLLRIFNEQLRKELKVDFGTGKEPKCAGFSIDQLAQADLSKFDFSEAADDFAFDEAQVKEKMRAAFLEGIENGKSLFQVQPEKTK